MTGYVPRERWNMALAVRARDAQLLVEINRALAQLAESGELRKIYAEHGVPFRPPFTGSAPRPPAAGHLAAHPRARRAGRQHGPRQPALFQREGRSARASTSSWPGPWPSSFTSSCGIEWLDVQHETAVGELLQHRCDLVFGEAVAANAVADDEELAGKILYSRPYYRTGYVLVRRKDGPRVRSLAELKGARSQRLGTEAGSVADYSLRQRGYLRRLYRNQLATLKALDDGDIDFAYLWANVGWTLHASPEFKLEIVPRHEPEDHWNIAIAMRAGNDELKRQVDAALEALIADGTVARALARYHVPHDDVVPEPARDGQGSTEPAIHHGVADRGLEPECSGSRRPSIPTPDWPGFARPASWWWAWTRTTCRSPRRIPVPGGLDYEIAGLLAEQLGVPLRVYWAYSSHDSYPSKLATKRLCDVILGVMPDDRFGQRVLYSRPYYRREVPRGRPVAARAARGPRRPWPWRRASRCSGLKGRSVQTLSQHRGDPGGRGDGTEQGGLRDLDAGPLAGGASDGRASWSSHPSAESADRFPICAAVRKSDRDLKDAIDRAWDELDRSGRAGPGLRPLAHPVSNPFRLASRGKGRSREQIHARETSGMRGLDPEHGSGGLGRHRDGSRRGTVAAGASRRPARPPARTRRPWRRARRCFAACAAAVTAAPAAAARGPT